MRIRLTPAAAADLQSISDYLKEHHPRYHDPTTRKLYGTIRELKEWPGRGRPGREEGTREICFRPRPMLRCTVLESRALKSCGFITVRRTGHNWEQAP
jgi:plasmid stabilization system protein ParE